MPTVQKISSRIQLLAALLAGACLSLVICRLEGFGIGAALSKLIASSIFIAVACLSGAMRSSYGRMIFLGLVCSWFGDMFLLGESRPFFLAGLVGFLLAHAAYIAAFSVHGMSDRWTLSALLPVALISLLVTAWLAPFLPADMVMPVRAYTFVISLMVITAFGARGAGATVLIPLGATLFYFSDLSVASMQFTRPTFPNYIWGLPFYYTGQLMLAMSIAFVIKEEQRKHE